MLRGTGGRWRQRGLAERVAADLEDFVSKAIARASRTIRVTYAADHALGAINPSRLLSKG